MSDNYSHIDHLISQYLSDKATDGEREELEEWLAASAENRILFEHLKNIWSAPSTDEYDERMDSVKERIWADGTLEEEEETGISLKRNIRLWAWRAAASIVILFGIGIYYISDSFDNKPFNEEKSSVVWVEQVSPAGKRSIYFLPDGTKVWLNAGSSIGYSENFTDTSRYVRLEGEAFFEVVKDPQRPFIVESNGIAVQALGTAFNVSQNSENKDITVALLEGKVRIENSEKSHTTILKPGEQLVASKNNTVFATEHFTYDETFGWKDGLLTLQNDNFTAFCRKIEQWYDVKVEVKGRTPDDWEIRAKYKNESLDNVLKDLSFNKSFQYKIEDKKVYLKF